MLLHRAAPLLFALCVVACSTPVGPADAASDGDARRADGDPIEPIPPLPVTEEEHIRACARLGACTPSGARELSVCASSFVFFLGDSQLAELALLVRCVNEAGNDCARVQACTNLGAAPVACDPATTPQRCDGDVARSCRARTGLTYAIDCGAIGQRCAIDRLDRATCGLGSCEIGAPDRCEGNRLVQCTDGVITFADCARAGLRCISLGPNPGVDAGISPARCAGRGTQCSPEAFGQGCLGGVLRACLGGYGAQIDCRGVFPEFTCFQDAASGAPRCARVEMPVCAADPFNGTDFPERCDGSAIVYCRDGVEARLDCASIGFARCDDTTATPPHCAP